VLFISFIFLWRVRAANAARDLRILGNRARDRQREKTAEFLPFSRQKNN
jgi:hypothetical protein